MHFFLRTVHALFLTVLILLLQHCTEGLKQPVAPPKYSVNGLFYYQEGSEIRLLRILCEDTQDCYFRHQLRTFTERLVSGETIEVIERKGRVLTSVNEILLEQEFFSRFTIPCSAETESESETDFSLDHCSFRKLDREFYSSKSFELLGVEEDRLILDEDVIYRKVCEGSKCSRPAGILFGPGKPGGFSLDFDLLSKEQLSGIVTAREGRFRTGKSLKAKEAFEIFYLDYTDDLLNAYKQALVVKHEGKTGADEEQEAAETAEKERNEKRRADIRKRIEAGEEVSKEELLEVLEN